MEVQREQRLRLIFELNEREARWLKAFIQNPHCSLEDEPIADRRIREKLFNSLKLNLRD